MGNERGPGVQGDIIHYNKQVTNPGTREPEDTKGLIPIRAASKIT